jgi:hypothetical protein
MSRLAFPSVDDVPGASKPLLAAVQKQPGVAPNMVKLHTVARAEVDFPRVSTHLPA